MSDYTNKGKLWKTNTSNPKAPTHSGKITLPNGDVCSIVGWLQPDGSLSLLLNGVDNKPKPLDETVSTNKDIPDVFNSGRIEF